MLQPTIQLYRNAYGGLSRDIWWLSLVMLVNRSGTMVIPFLTLYVASIGYSEIEAGYAMTAFGVGSILGGYIGGRFTDRFGYYYLQIFTLLCSGLMFIVLAQMDALMHIILCVFLLSTLGEGFRPANSAAIAAYSNDANRIRSYSLNRLAVNLGFAIGPAIGGALSQISWELLFYADAATCFLAALILVLKFKKDSPAEKIRTAKEIRAESAFRDGPFLAGMFCVFLTGVCFLQFFSIIPLFYDQVLGYSGFVIGLLLAMNGAIIFLFEMLIVYKLEPRNKTMDYIIRGTFLIGLAFLVLIIAPITSIVLLSMFILTLGEMLMFPFMNNFWIKRSNEHNRGQYAAVYTMAFAAAWVVSPTFSTTIISRAGFSWLWIVDFGICTLATIGFIFLKKNRNVYERV